MQMYQQDAVVEKGMTDDDLTYARADVIVGCMFAILVAICIIIATASTIYTASEGQGMVIETAEQAALALVPLVGPYASYLFAAGIFGASMLAAGVLPLATARSVCEAFGFERGVELELQEAPIFYGLLTILIVGGTVIALLPGIPVVRVLIVAQAINCVVLPILLVFITLMSADTRLVGRFANGRIHSAASWVVTVVIGFLALTVLGSTLYQAIMG
jgi:Mn2+/Fe2+ NRAMP family transporter